MATITCDDPELHVSSGSVSSMPGSSHAFPKGAMCDSHPKVPAVARIQGETDSFGCEYHLMCQACLDEHRAAVREAFNAESYCDYCKTMQRYCSPMRDYDEGMGGPVYNVCGTCRARVDARIAEELDYYDSKYGPLDDYDDHYHDEDFDEEIQDWKVVDTTSKGEDGNFIVVATCWDEKEAELAIKSLGKESRENYAKMVEGHYRIDSPYSGN